jgi:hypothetical protein
VFVSKIGRYLIFLAIGVFFALETFHIVDIYQTNLWPIVLLVAGLSIHVLYFMNGAPKDLAFLLLPGGIALSLGNLLISDGNHYFVWSLYLLGIAFGLFEWQVFGEKEDFSVPIIVVVILSFVFMFYNGFSYFYLWPFVFIGGCCYVITKKSNIYQVHSREAGP